MTSVRVLLTYKSMIAQATVTRESISVYNMGTFYSPDFRRAQRLLTGWFRAEGYQPAGRWAKTGPGRWSREFTDRRPVDALDPPPKYLASGKV